MSVALWTACETSLIKDPFKQNYRHLQLHCAPTLTFRFEQVIYCDKSYFNLCYHSSHICVRRCAVNTRFWGVLLNVIILRQAFKICLTQCHFVKQHLLQPVTATSNTDFGQLVLFFNIIICLYLYQSFVYQISFNSDDSMALQILMTILQT